MVKKIFVVFIVIFISCSVFSCKKKETSKATGNAMPSPVEQGQIPTGPLMQGPVGTEGQQPMGPGMMMPRSQAKIVVPDFVKGKWKAAKILFEDRVANKKHEYVVKLNSDFKIPDSPLKITVGEYLPDFRMEGLTLTSVSNNTNNPALAIKVFENDKQIFPTPNKEWGWLFEKVPTIHPFQHERYSLILKKGIKK